MELLYKYKVTISVGGLALEGRVFTISEAHKSFFLKQMSTKKVYAV